MLFARCNGFLSLFFFRCWGHEQSEGEFCRRGRFNATKNQIDREEEGEDMVGKQADGRTAGRKSVTYNSHYILLPSWMGGLCRGLHCWDSVSHTRFMYAFRLCWTWRRRWWCTTFIRWKMEGLDRVASVSNGRERKRMALRQGGRGMRKSIRIIVCNPTSPPPVHVSHSFARSLFSFGYECALRISQRQKQQQQQQTVHA